VDTGRHQRDTGHDRGPCCDVLPVLAPPLACIRQGALVRFRVGVEIRVRRRPDPRRREEGLWTYAAGSYLREAQLQVRRASIDRPRISRSFSSLTEPPPSMKSYSLPGVNPEAISSLLSLLTPSLNRSLQQFLDSTTTRSEEPPTPVSETVDELPA
jgi:hypothetical protein